MSRRTRRRARPVIEGLVNAIESHGFSVVFQEYIEDAETPGLLGHGAGVTMRDAKKVKISTRLTAAQQVAALEHELEHVLGAERGTDRPDLGLMCGGKGVLQ